MESNHIYLGDCLEVMKGIADKSVEMICCDPPYNCLHKDNPNAQWDRIIPFEPLWEQYERIIKDNGAIVLFGQGLFTAKLILSNEKLYRYSLVWDKQRVTAFLNANRMPLRCHEDIVVFYKSLPTYNPQYEVGLPNHSRGNGIHKNTNQCYGKYNHNHKGKVYEEVARVEPTVPEGMKLPRSIISIRKEHESSTVHPTQKSVDIMRYLIRTYSNDGDVVLDSCMGSGTTCVAAIKEKRKYIGIEMQEEYFNIAKKRIELELSQPTLW